MSIPTPPPVFVDHVTPINADEFNDAFGNVYDNANAAYSSAQLAKQYADQAGAPADDQIATLMATPGSLTRQQLAPSIVGPYSARPAANTVPPRTVFYANDLPEEYQSDGTTWRVVGSGGVELAYAELTSVFARTYNGATVDVSGLTVTWVQPERPVVIEFSGLMACGSSTPLAWLRLFLGSTTAIGVCGTATVGQNVSVGRRIRLSPATHGLVPGQTYTVLGRLDMPGGTSGVSSAQINASTTNPASLVVVTA